MDDMTPLLRAIAHSPDDDTPRLALADWLDEHGHHERAEFIRLQIDLARTNPGDAGYPEKTARMRRCGVFTAEGKTPFFDHLPTEGCKIGFHRGLIASIDTANAEQIDTSGFGLLPVQFLRTRDALVDHFKGFSHLKWLEYADGRDAKPARLLEILGPNGWFKELETLSLPELSAACLEAGVVPKFDLPRLRNFVLTSDSFFNLGRFAENPDGEEDDYGESRTWDGLPEYLPKHAVPNTNSPLERFVWHAADDSDYYRGHDRFWPGPTMESLLAHLKPHQPKQVEVAVDWDDHEGGGEGVDAAAYEHAPLALCPTLEHVTVNNDGLRLLNGTTQKLKSLRVYADYQLDDYLYTLLARPVCSELESLHVEVRAGYGIRPAGAAGVRLAKLRSLSGLGIEPFAAGEFPSLISMCGGLKTVLTRAWPNLQSLSATFDQFSELEAFARSSCCPNLTTLTLSGYFDPVRTDFSFLAECPHMPFLSLVRVPDYPMYRCWVVNDGELIPVRDDVMVDDLKPTTMYRISEVF